LTRQTDFGPEVSREPTGKLVKRKLRYEYLATVAATATGNLSPG
jgi:hypothetical protein